jgi:hypothetical protein
MQESQRDSHSRSEEPPGPLAIELIEERYAGRWVLTRVTKMTAQRRPLEAQVLASGTRSQVYKKLRRVFPAGANPEMPYYVFAAGAFSPRASSAPPAADPDAH